MACTVVVLVKKEFVLTYSDPFSAGIYWDSLCQLTSDLFGLRSWGPCFVAGGVSAIASQVSHPQPVTANGEAKPQVAVAKARQMQLSSESREYALALFRPTTINQLVYTCTFNKD